MALPRKLKNLNLFNDGNNHLGVVQSVTLPKLTRKTEAYRGGGMNGSVNTDLGMDDGALDTSFVCGGLVRQNIQSYGASKAGEHLYRFTAAVQRDDTGDVDAVEIVLRGRIKEIDRGEWKPGETSTETVSLAVSYYKESVNGEVDAEIDLVNMVETINGVDALAAQRRALGL
jgi:P2 family phage contractile tail tube protein